MTDLPTPNPEPDPAPGPRSTPARRALVALLLASLALLALFLLGRWLRDRLGHAQQLRFALADLALIPPPGLSRADFLSEVQYLGGLPDHLPIYEPASFARLAAAFTLHPWVDQVQGLQLRGAAGPLVRLAYRVPVLACAGRVVDARGILLPASCPLEGLPELPGIAPPRGSAGQVWDDPGVLGAARTAGFLQPWRAEFALTRLDLVPDGIALTLGTGQLVRWGPAVTDPPEHDADAVLRRDRLRRRLAQPGHDPAQPINLNPPD